MGTLLVRPHEIRGIVTMAEAVEAVRTGFREWGENPQLNAPRRRIHIPSGVRVSVHQGGVPAAGATGLMTHCEWVKPMAEEQVYPRLNHPVITNVRFAILEAQSMQFAKLKSGFRRTLESGSITNQQKNG
jgi:hypothetical protein